MPIQVRLAQLDEILPLRQAVIIAGTGRDSPYFPGDDADTTRHAGVFDAGRCIGCATFIRAEHPNGGPAWQLRGMATATDRRGEGWGKALLAFALTALTDESGLGVFWCNARAAAAGFYKNQGWRTLSGPFVVEGVGPHYRMGIER